MTDWEEFHAILRDQIPLHYHIYRLETVYVNHPEDQHSYQTLRILEGGKILWRIGDALQKEHSIIDRARAERAEKKALITYHFRQKKKILCPCTNKWSDVDPALLIP